MGNIQMVDLATQYQRMKGEIDAALQEVIDSTAFIGGPAVKEFSDNLAHYLGAKHLIPCANGTDALQIAIMALDPKPGDEIITTPFTFVATAEVVALLQLKPVFVDIEPGTFNIDPNKIEEAITDRTKAIIPVHLFGQACNMEKLLAISTKYDIPLIEDNAQATGAKYTFPDGRTEMLGTMGAIGTTSFYPTKNLGAYGDGGAVSTNDDGLAHKLRLIANHGSDRKYYYDSIGVNSRLDAMQAVILNVKLKYLDEYNKHRCWAADQYDARLKDVEGITIPPRADYAHHVFHQYTIRVADDRDGMQTYLKEHGIPSMIYYPVPLHISSAYAYYGYNPGDFPVSEKAAKEVLSLPIHSELTEEQIDYITETIIAYTR